MKKKFTGLPSYGSLTTYVKTLGRADVEEMEEAAKEKSERGGNHMNDTNFNDAMEAKIDAIFKKDRYTTNTQLATVLGVSSQWDLQDDGEGGHLDI